MRSNFAQITLAVTACALVVAACGSSSNPSTQASALPSKAQAYSDALQFARCMRAHGVTNFPDPSNGGGGIQIGGGGFKPDAPAVQSARQACQKYLPGIGKSFGHMTASERAAAVRFAECMRSHGEPDFPDPIQTAPSMTASQQVAVISLKGMQFQLPPGLDPKNPTFEQAASACGIKPPPGAVGG